MRYVSIRQKPSDKNIFDAVRIEIDIHRRKILRHIKDTNKMRVEFFKFFKEEICEDIRKEHRPSNSPIYFLKKIANEVWDHIPEIQAIVNIKKFNDQETKKRTARERKAKFRRMNRDGQKKPDSPKETKVELELKKQLKLF